MSFLGRAITESMGASDMLEVTSHELSISRKYYQEPQQYAFETSARRFHGLVHTRAVHASVSKRDRHSCGCQPMYSSVKHFASNFVLIIHAPRLQRQQHGQPRGRSGASFQVGRAVWSVRKRAGVPLVVPFHLQVRGPLVNLSAISSCYVPYCQRVLFAVPTDRRRFYISIRLSTCPIYNQHSTCVLSYSGPDSVAS